MMEDDRTVAKKLRERKKELMNLFLKMKRIHGSKYHHNAVLLTELTNSFEEDSMDESEMSDESNPDRERYNKSFITSITKEK
mmetsp:Transcript_6965/g.11169  ORF Transcript_6965/g.11169 Transcript_6965/m.11169 type:complete len:82 (-) Transcript_6965:764-1009(-)